MNALLEWLNEPMTLSFWRWCISFMGGCAIFSGLRFLARLVAGRRTSRFANGNQLLLFERVTQVEKQITNLATTCADNTARLAGIEEYLQDKQLAAAMFGKRPGEPERPIYLPKGEARRLGNVEFQAGDFPVMLAPKGDFSPSTEWSEAKAPIVKDLLEIQNRMEQERLSPGERFIAEQERLMKAKLLDQAGVPNATLRPKGSA